MSPCSRAGWVRRQARKPRKADSTDCGSCACTATAAAWCSAGIGSHGLPVVKPASGASIHGNGVRQPSRPLKFGQKVIPYGSCSASNGTSASARPSSSPWYRQTEPRREHSSATSIRARRGSAGWPPQRLTARSTSWLDTAQHGQPWVIAASSRDTVSRM
ncbi:hypothetical protein D3C72_915960 [compost metagenome]